jgi:4-diphosphocytidyl-2-C-methyl-D-erythritol kinase
MTAELLAARAPAKVNLTLHVLGRREDGYHELESLVAFAGCGDGLTLEPGPGLALEISGPSAGAAGRLDDNLVLKAARALAERRPGLLLGRFRLLKRLPVAAGIGGGSSDAAAALRLLARANRLAPGDPDLWAAARATGADVPVCLEPAARMMRGVGERLGPALNLPTLHAVLLNPGVPVPTAAVFRALGLRPGALDPSRAHPALPLDPDPLLRALIGARNDLETAARTLAPVIGEAAARLEAAGASLVRMSGSGATLFGLFPTCRAAAAAARSIKAESPSWWVRPTVLR